MPPRYRGPHAFVQVIEPNLGYDFDGGDGAGKTNLARYKETNDECVDGTGNSPTYRFCK